jgi:PhzF family phenazine biosynthesis protein
MRFAQIDVFTARPCFGNPVAVLLEAEGLDSEAMQRIARWTNLSETAFVLPPSTPEASYRVRIFTPAQELPFAGHPSVGTAYAVLAAGLAEASDGMLVQECGAGLLPVRVEGEGESRRIHVRAPQARLLDSPADSDALLDAALGALPRGELAPRIVDNGPRWWTVEIAEAAALRALQPDLAAIATLTTATNTVGLALFGECAKEDHSLVVRCFCPADGIPEDPVTGSANACIGARLLAEGRYHVGEHYIASQGREMGRDGRIEVSLGEDGVWIGGRCVSVIEGRIAL